MIPLLVLALVQSAAPSRVLTLAEAERVAQERQPQLRAARASTQAAQGRVEQSRSGLLPQLSASAGYERTTDNLVFRPGAATTSAHGTSWNSLNLFDSAVTVSQLLWDFGQTSQRWRSTWNLFQGGLTNGAVHEAQANLDNAAAQLDVEKQQVRVDVEQALLAIRAAKAAQSASTDALVAARQRLALAEGRYQNGSGSVIELGDVQTAEANAAGQVVQTEFQLATARAQLARALGRA